jgi:hypothetical protein
MPDDFFVTADDQEMPTASDGQPVSLNKKEILREMRRFEMQHSCQAELDQANPSQRIHCQLFLKRKLAYQATILQCTIIEGGLSLTVFNICLQP